MARTATRAAGFILGSALALAIGPAWAQESPAAGWLRPGGYVGLSGLVVVLQDSSLEDPTVPTVSAELSTDTGFGIAGFAGYRFGNGFRGEIELAFRQNDLDQITLNDPFGVLIGIPVAGSAPVSGDLSSLAVMVNGYYDIATSSALVPYLGLGIGLASVTLDSSDLLVDDSDTVFAFQARAGLSLAVTPTFALFGGYTFFVTTDPTIAGTDLEYRSHNFEIGARFGF